MILIALIFAAVMYGEIRYLKRKQVKLKPYVIIYSVLLVASELIYMVRHHD